MSKILILFICLVLSGCGSVVMVGKIPFNYSHNYEMKAAIDLQEIKRIAILSFNGPGGRSIQNGLENMFSQTGQVKVLDNAELSQIIQEKQLEVTDSTIQQLGNILDVDLLVTGDVVLSDGITVITHLRLLDATGRIVFSCTIGARDISSVIEGATIIISDIQTPVNVDQKLFVDSKDADRQTIANLIAEQRIQELRDLLQQKIPFAITGTFEDKSYYHYDLAVVYEALNEVDRAQAELGKGIQKTVWLQNRKKFTSYKEYLDNKAMERPQITSVSYQSLQENAPKIAVLGFRAADDKAWRIASDLTAAITVLGKYNIYGQDELLKLFAEEDIPEQILSQIVTADYIISGTAKKSGITLRTTSEDDSIERALYEIEFRITDAKTGEIKATEKISGEYPMQEVLSRERSLYEARIDAVDKFVRKISSLL